jgi:hypothetical protein
VVDVADECLAERTQSRKEMGISFYAFIVLEDLLDNTKAFDKVLLWSIEMRWEI